MLVIDILENSSKNFPNKEALVSKDKRFTYSQLQRMVNQLSAALTKEGIRKGHRVVILLRNTFEVVIAYFAILKIGAIEVTLDVTTDSPEDITYKFKDCQPEALITNRLYINLVPEALSKVPSLKIAFFTEEPKALKSFKQKCILLEEIFKSQEPKDIKTDAKKRDLAVIAYTSGTTGLPKGIMLTHENLISAAESMSMVYHKDRTLLLVPFQHTFGKAVVNSRFLKGATIILTENVAFPAEVLKLVQKSKATSIVSSPTVYRMLLEALKEKRKYYNFDKLEYIVTGGAKLPKEIFIEYWKLFPSLCIQSGYGLTEIGGKASGICFMRKPRNTHKLTCCGKVINGHERKIVNEKGIKVAAGEIGEIIFKGPSVMKGYWRNQEETKKVIKDGWLYTGDLGKIDEEGDLYIIDRKKDIIKSGGVLISPKEIEIVIDSHPHVKESAVIGIDDELMGEKIKVFVVLKPGKRTKEEEIREFCSKKFTPIKIPSVIEFCSSLPKSTLDKVKKMELRKKKGE
jgi:long-chain acyl-CoA synthetase